MNPFARLNMGNLMMAGVFFFGFFFFGIKELVMNNDKLDLILAVVGLTGLLCVVMIGIGIFVGIKIEDRWDIEDRGYNYRRVKNRKRAPK